MDSSQQLPGEAMAAEPPQLEGQDSAVVSAYLAMYVDGSLPDETIEDRFGPAALQLFKARRFGNRKLVDDPGAWQVSRSWTKGEILDEDIVQEYGADFLATLRNELELQGGTTPSGLREADGDREGRPNDGNLAVMAWSTEAPGQGGDAASLWNSEDQRDIAATVLFDSRESVHGTNADLSSGAPQADVSAVVPAVEQQAMVDSQSALVDERVAELGEGGCGPDVSAGSCSNDGMDKELCGKPN